MESTTLDQANYAGLDIAKDRLDYALPDERAGHVSNTADGHARLLKLLHGFDAVRVVCEASGGYERAVVAALLAAGLEVCVVQPGRVRAFAHAEGLLARPMQIDAALLRRFGQKMQPRLAVPADAAATTLRELLEHRRGLSDQLVAVRNRLELAGKTLRSLLERQERFLQKEFATVETMLAAHLEQDPTLRDKAARLRQLQGVGPVLAATLLGYVPELGQSNRRNSGSGRRGAIRARQWPEFARLRHVPAAAPSCATCSTWPRWPRPASIPSWQPSTRDSSPPANRRRAIRLLLYWSTNFVLLPFSVSDAAEDVIAVIRAGARGYVTKNISGEELAEAVRPSVFTMAMPSSSSPSRPSCWTRRARRPSPSRSWTRSLHASARCSSASPRLHVQGDRAAPRDLAEDGGGMSSVLRKLPAVGRRTG